nr:MAG: tRNA 2-thiouridine(34) synthase MnmA [Pseudomonadota bacterium]
MRVVVAMSGGVDSSAAAALLVEQGHEVIGVSLRLTRTDRAGPGRCCTPDDLEDARAVARTLGIPFYVLEATELFERQVISPFVRSYLAGETPIPCLACNREVKFDHLLRRARALGARLATGHYARIVQGEDGRYRLLRGVDEARDQSYFLHHLGQEELRDLLFPVGHLHKAEARELARRAGLPVADKAESQDICFIPDGDAAGFVDRRAAAEGLSPRPGRLVDAAGRELGRHDGVHRFTIGQRKGLGEAVDRFPAPRGQKLPLYVSEIRPDTGDVVVGPAAEVERDRFFVRDVSWVSGFPPAPDDVLLVRVRHRHAGTPCRVRPVRGAWEVAALERVRAPAPGQAAVFYRGDEVLGGGRISRLTDAEAGGYATGNPSQP